MEIDRHAHPTVTWFEESEGSNVSRCSYTYANSRKRLSPVLSLSVCMHAPILGQTSNASIYTITYHPRLPIYASGCTNLRLLSLSISLSCRVTKKFVTRKHLRETALREKSSAGLRSFVTHTRRDLYMVVYVST